MIARSCLSLSSKVGAFPTRPDSAKNLDSDKFASFASSTSRVYSPSVSLTNARLVYCFCLPIDNLFRADQQNECLSERDRAKTYPALPSAIPLLDVRTSQRNSVHILDSLSLLD